MERLKEKIISSELYKIVPFQTMKEIGNLLGNKLTMEILQYLNYDPMRYSELKQLLNCDDDNTLSRRLKDLKKHNLITQIPVVKREKIDEYTLTEKGQELIKFFRNFEKNKEGK